MLVAGVLLLAILIRRKQTGLLRDFLFLLIGVYALLHLVVMALAWQGVLPSLSGLLIDLRYLFFFSLVYLALKLHPNWRTLFVKVGIVGALIVTLFGVLQLTVLPNDVLKHIGYDRTTIVPYLTVDDNPAFVRINSTLRGPNPLGAYVVIVLAALSAFVLKGNMRTRKLEIWAAVLAAGGVMVVAATYSRSAWLALMAAILIVVAVSLRKQFSKKTWAIVGSSLVVIGALTVGASLTTWGHHFLSTVVLHEDPNGGNEINSNEGHADSIEQAWSQVALHPAGVGVGSTGSASLLGDSPIIIENQYLFIAHEVGWFGILLFVLILLVVLVRLWQVRSDWLALGTFASGIGLALIGVLQPVWVDDTVSIVWWGLAAVVLATPQIAKPTIHRSRRIGRHQPR